MDTPNKSNNYNKLLKSLLIIAVCFFCFLIISAILAQLLMRWMPTASRELYLAQSAVQNIVAFCGIAILSACLITHSPWSLLGINEKVSWRPFLGLIIVFIIGMPAMNQLIYYNSQLSLPESFRSIENAMREMEEMSQQITQVILNSNSFGGLLVGILLIGVLTGLSEEFLFRGLLQGVLTRYSNLGKWAIWIVAFIFSAIHLQFLGFFPRLLLGAFFGYTLYSTGSIWPAVFAHALNNSLVVATDWVSRNTTYNINAENWGVAESGFPLTATVSLVLTTLFFIRYYNCFFNGRKR